MNFSFFNPAFLYTLPLVFIPVLIHLFSVKKSRVQKFPEIKFIKLAVKQTLIKIRLRQLLLLLLRILMIIIIILVFSRPVIHLIKNNPGGSEKPQTLCLLLDNSYSLGAVFKNSSSFERGKEACLKLLASLKESDSVSFALMSDRVKPLTKGFTSDLAATAEQIKNANLSFNTTSVAAGLNYGYSELKQSPGSKKQIIVVTDLALHGFNNEFKLFKDYDRNVNLIFVDVSEKASNLALAGLTASSPASEEPVKISFTVENYSDTKYLKTPVSLVMNKVKAAYGFIDSYPGKKSVKNLYFSPEKKETETGYVRLEAGDALAADNIAYVTARAPEKSRVLLVDGDLKIAQFQNETFFLKLALNPEERFFGEVIATVCVPGELGGKNLFDFKAVFLCNVESFTPLIAAKLKEYLGEGGNLVYFLGDRINAKDYSKLEPELFPAFISGSEEGLFRMDPANTSVNHPVFRQTFAVELAKAGFYRHYNLAPKKNSFAVSSFTNGAPFMLENKGIKGKQGKVVIFPFPADREWSDFPMRPAYLPFVQELAKHLTENTGKEDTASIFVGETFKRTFSPAETPVKLELTVPNGAPVVYIPKNNVFEFAGTVTPGIYTLQYSNRKGERKTESFAVNLDVLSGESDFKKQDQEGIKRALPESTSFFLIKDYKNIASEVLVLLRGKELTRPLIILLLLLFTFEGILSLRRFL